MEIGTKVIAPGNRLGVVVREFPPSCCPQAAHFSGIHNVFKGQVPRVLVLDENGWVQGFDVEWLQPDTGKDYQKP